MVSQPWMVCTLLVSCLSVACENRGPRILRDTEGRTFEATCPKSGTCRVEQRSGPRRATKAQHVLWLGSRLVGVCDVGPDGTPEGPFDCRPLGCGSDAECPPLHAMKEGQCLNGRCSDPSAPLGPQDSIMLCLAGSGLGKETAAQIDRYALGLNCGTPCVVPAPCPQL